MHAAGGAGEAGGTPTTVSLAAARRGALSRFGVAPSRPAGDRLPADALFDDPTLSQWPKPTVPRLTVHARRLDLCIASFYRLQALRVRYRVYVVSVRPRLQPPIQGRPGNLTSR